MEKLRELRDEVRQRGQLSAAIRAEVKRGEARRFTSNKSKAAKPANSIA
jgi:hypothetical protein